MAEYFFFDPNHPPFYQLISFTEPGVHTFYMSSVTPPDDGYDIDYILVTCYGGGDGGDCVNPGTAEGGRNGGRRTVRVSPGIVGSSQSVIVGAGGAGRSSQGRGGAGGVSSFGGLVTSSPDTSSIQTIFGDIASSARPGSGGVSGSYVTSGDSGSYSVGGNGESSSSALGGRGVVPSGWFGSASAAENGSDGSTFGWYTTGGSGGGGGGRGNGLGGSGGSDAGHGGAPGGGGGGAKQVRSGDGGRGQVDVLIVFKPATSSFA